MRINKIWAVVFMKNICYEKNKIRLIFLLISTTILVNSCSFEDSRKDTLNNSNSLNVVSETISKDIESLNEKLDIYNLPNPDDITTIYHYGSITQTPTGLFYSKQIHDDKSSDFIREYYLYSFESQCETPLFSIGNWIYEVFYDSVVINNNLYVIIITGNVTTYQNLELNLYQINLQNTDTKLLYNCKIETPYVSMSAFNDKLILSIPGSEKCDIIEIDLKTHANKNVLNFYFDNTLQNGDSIRQLYADNNSLYLLRLKMNNEDDAHLYIDTLDSSYKTSNSLEITEQLLNVVGTEVNEIRQLVSKFFYINENIYYENFSITRFLGSLGKHSIMPIMPTDALFSMASDTLQDNIIIFYKSFDKEKTIYLFSPDSKKVEISNLCSEENSYYITYVTKCENNVIVYENYKDETSGHNYPSKAYFFNISDIKWNVNE